MVAERVVVTQQVTRLPTEDLFSGDYSMGDSMSDLQLWSQLVAKWSEGGLDDDWYANVSQARRHSPPRALCVTMNERKLDGMQAFMSGNLKIKGNMMLAILTLSAEFAGPLRTTDDPLPSRVAARTTSVPDVSVSFEKEHLPIATCGHDGGGKITTTTRNWMSFPSESLTS